METRKIVAALYLSFMFSLVLGSSTSHSKPINLPSSNLSYSVVIGAFSIRENAIRFTGRAGNLPHNARYEFNPDRSLYYVLTLTTENKEQAMQEAKRLREETSYRDAWVYQRGEVETPREDINPVTEQKMEEVPAEKIVTVEPTVEEPATEKEVVMEGKKFFFNSYRATDNKEVNANVEAIDIDRSRKMGSYKANDVIYLPSPKNNSGKVSLISRAFGYRSAQVDIDYNNPSGDNIAIDESKGVVVPFELIRLRKGDIVVMYNVFFFKDAAVMMPESRFEVEALQNMMNENPKCKIRIHGHTNGNASGKIISVGETKNFFSLDGTKESTGSAKALSEARAAVIKDYLVNGGIEPQRMEVKAWGGKKALYDKDSSKAKENVRVEVEILED